MGPTDTLARGESRESARGALGPPSLASSSTHRVASRRSARPGGIATTNLTLQGAMRGDLCLASLSSAIDSEILDVSSRVVVDGKALVILRNLGRTGVQLTAEPIDVALGLLRVAALQYV